MCHSVFSPALLLNLIQEQGGHLSLKPMEHGSRMKVTPTFCVALTTQWVAQQPKLFVNRFDISFMV